MTSNTNINSDKSEAQLYEVLLYKKKDIIAIQKKLGMFLDPGKGSIESKNQIALNQSKKRKILEDSFELLFDLVEELIDIQKDLDVDCHPILIILYNNIHDLEGETYGKRSLGILYHLLLYLEEDISIIQNVLDIVSHSDQEISGLEETNKNARVYLQNF